MNQRMNNRCWCVFCWLAAGLVLSLLATIPSQVDAAESSAGSENSKIERSVEKDGVRLTMQLDRDKSNVADPIGLELRIEAPEGIKITAPNLPAEIGNLHVRQTSNQADVPAGKLRVWTQKYEMESFVAGTAELPVIKMAYQSSSGNPQDQQLELPAVPLSINSLIATDADPAQFRDIKGTVELPAPYSFPAWGYVAASIVALIATAAFLRLWWHRKPLTTDQWAIAELNRINVPLMVEQDRVQELYFLVTGIVRTYIERRFGVHAPKKTTTEFLSEAQHHPFLAGKHQESLGEFLEAADRVKFARWSPDSAQIEATVAGARWFVETTAQSSDTNPMRKQGVKQNKSQTPVASALG